jgi:hypothetical protein
MPRFARALSGLAEAGSRLHLQVGCTFRLNRIVDWHASLLNGWTPHSLPVSQKTATRPEGKVVALAAVIALLSAVTGTPSSADEDTPAVGNKHTAKFKIFCDKARRCTYEVCTSRESGCA